MKHYFINKIRDVYVEVINEIGRDKSFIALQIVYYGALQALRNTTQIEMEMIKERLKKLEEKQHDK